MAKSYLKLDTRRPLKDGTYPVVIGVGYGRDMYLPTGVSCQRDEWDATLLCTGKGARQSNAVLKTLLSQVNSRIMDLRERGAFDRMDNKRLKAHLTSSEAGEPDEPKGKSLAELFRIVMGAKSKRTAEIYGSTLSRLSRWCDPSAVTFDEVNKLWLDGFVASMSDISANTKSIHLRNLRAVNNYALDMEETKSYAFRRYAMPKATSRKRSMPVECLRNLAALPLGHNAIYRDIFMLTFYLIGINFVDLCRLTEIKRGRVEYERAKTHKPYSVKVEPEAMEIIERLRGKRQLLYMLDEHYDYRSYYRQLRRGLAAVLRAYNAAYPDAPLDELTTYWARHTWATVAASLDVPKDTISHALGHDMGSRVTAIYIDFDQAKVDEANRKVIDYVLGK